MLVTTNIEDAAPYRPDQLTTTIIAYVLTLLPVSAERVIRDGPAGSSISTSSSTSVQGSSQSASLSASKPPAGGRKEVELEVEVYKPNGESTVESKQQHVDV